MKANVVKASLVELVPENDAEAALLGLWAEQAARVASSMYSEGKTLAVLVEFCEHKNSSIETAEKQAEGHDG